MKRNFNAYLAAFLITLITPIYGHCTEVVAKLEFSSADGISVDNQGNIFVSGGIETNNMVMAITAQDTASVLAEGFSSTNGMDIDSKGNIIVADYQASKVFKILPSGEKEVLAESLDGPAGVWVDKNDHVIVGLFGANFSGKGSKVIKIDENKNITTLAEGQGLSDVIGVAGDDNNTYYAVHWGNGEVFEIKNEKVTVIADTDLNLNMIDYFEGHIYLPGPSKGKVYSLDIKTKILNELKLNLPENEKLTGPNAVRVNSKDRSLLILDPKGQRIFSHTL